MATDYMPEQRDWNMNLAWLKEIDRQIARGHDQRELGNLFGWWNSLRSIYGMLYYDIKEPGHEEEEAELKNLFETADRMAFSINVPGARESMHRLLDNIEFRLKYLMRTYDYVSLKAKKTSPDTAIEDEMG